MCGIFTMHHCSKLFRRSIVLLAILFSSLTVCLYSQTETMPSGSGTSSDLYLTASLDS